MVKTPGWWKWLVVSAATVLVIIGLVVVLVLWLVRRKRLERFKTEKLLNEKSNLIFPKQGIGQTQQTFEEIRHDMIESPTVCESQYLGPRSSFGVYNLPKKHRAYGSISDSLSISQTESYKSRKASTDSGIASSIGIGNVIPDLYQRRSTIIRRESSPTVSTCGSLHFKLLYLFRTSDLMVKIEKVSDVPPIIVSQFVVNKRNLNSYMTIEMSPAVDQKIRQTSLKRNVVSPVFEETFKLPIAYEELYTHNLIFSIYDLDEIDFSKQKFAKSSFALNTVDPSMEVEILLDLIIIEPERRETRGQLLVSLNYLPSVERLTIVIMKAKNLLIPYINAENNNYMVRINQFENGKIIKKRKTGLQKADNLVWNEVLMFKFHKDKVDEIHFEVVLIHKDENGIERNVGDVVLGKNSSSPTGMEHFYDIICDSKEPFAMWHNLQKDL